MKKKIHFRPRGHKATPEALRELAELIGDMPLQRDLLLEYLHRINDRHSCLPAVLLVALAEYMQLATTEVYEVATFYHHFTFVAEGEAKPPPRIIRVCDSISCRMAGGSAIADKIEEQLEKSHNQNFRLQRVPCVGRCDGAPVAVVEGKHVQRAHAGSLWSLIESGRGRDGIDDESVSPVRFQAYREDGGYRLWIACASGERSVESLIEELDTANLRGLGGAGFPVARKWQVLRDQPKPRLVAVNADEGEPGTFKDRYWLERDPHRFLEGMLIAAWAVEALSCYIYVRDEYPELIQLLREEIDALTAADLAPLPEIHLRRGAGAYICGEESAMIESLEGKRGMPRLRPPYVAEVGLFGRPTLEHNCETLFWVRDIVERGGAWFANHGRRGRKGLRSFSVSGRVAKPGVHQAPAGISVRELIDEYCGGMAEGHKFYGYFPGGASGGILPASLGDVPLDFDTLQEHGCFIGSAAIIVLSEQDSAREAASDAMRFFAEESCGQCTPCRTGTIKSEELMAEKTWNLDKLEDLAQVMEDASICGLGQAAANPMRSVVRYFPHEITLGGESQ